MVRRDDGCTPTASRGWSCDSGEIEQSLALERNLGKYSISGCRFKVVREVRVRSRVDR